MITIATTAGLREDGRPALEGRSIAALDVANGVAWAVVDESEVWCRAGGEWARAAAVPGEALRCLLSTEDGVLAGTASARLLRVVDGQVEPLQGFEAAPGRKEWFTPWGGPPAVRSMAAGADGELYVNVHVGGILRSDDGGAGWRPTIDIRTDVHQVVAPAGRPGLVLAAAGVGFAISRDGGESWSLGREGLEGRYCRAVALAGDVILLTASDGPRARRAGVYRRRLDDDGPFERCTTGLPEWFEGNIDTGCLAADGDVAVFGTHDGRAFVSEDAGATWSEAASGLARVLGLALTSGRAVAPGARGVR
jgi:hypothetical protein